MIDEEHVSPEPCVLLYYYYYKCLLIRCCCPHQCPDVLQMSDERYTPYVMKRM
jgi:hypothetical protein